MAASRAHGPDPTRRPQVCLVATELLGLVRNGGIATATTHAALVLAGAGYDVELLYCGHTPTFDGDWASRYAEAGIRVRWLDRAPRAEPPVAADSYRVLLQLVRSSPDIVVFQDWQGLGFCSMLAKHAGAALGQTKLVHICHGPTDWLREANRQLAFSIDDLVMARMERTSAELADAIVGPSRHLIDWMLAAGWDLPAERSVIPYFTEGHVAHLDATVEVTDDQPPLSELAFFGRLEERKGVGVFVEALNRLGPAALDGLTVTFLGRAATITPEDIRRGIHPAVLAVLADLRFEGDLDQAGARAYLARPGRMAVIPSLLDNSPNVIYECIEDQIPFVASDAGGNAELLHPADRDNILFAPDGPSLTALLDKILASGVVPRSGRPAFDGVSSLHAWERVLEPALQQADEDPSDEQAPTVTVVITHHDQGRHLRDAVDAAVDQDYGALEVIVVDDGNTDIAAREALADIEAGSWHRPVRVVRQDDGELGSARNHGLRTATSEYVAFCDDDDTLTPSHVSTLVRAARRTGAEAVSCALLALDEDATGELAAPSDGTVWVSVGGDPAIGTVYNTFSGAGLLVRREVALDDGGFHSTAGTGREDWALLARMTLRKRALLTVPLPLYHHRLRPDSLIRTTSQYRNATAVFDEYGPFLPEELRGWPALVRGQAELIGQLNQWLGQARVDIDWLQDELAKRNRYLDFLLRENGG